MSSVIQARIATQIGLLGLLPFIALAALLWMPWEPWQQTKLEFALIGYAAVVLSFVGAVHWGLAMATPEFGRPQAWNAFGWSITPALLGWLALLMNMLGLPTWLVFLFLAGDLLLARLVDGSLIPLYSAAAPWYLGLRTRLTAAASVSLLTAALAVAR
ncbi:MAG: DUF3429 domain-containing protein [Burkholderiaceae bacterium]